MDYQATLYNPLYAAHGVDATLILADSDETALEGLTAIDKTAGVSIGATIETQTVRPAADLRMAELTTLGITTAQLSEAELIMNGFHWSVETFLMRPSPKGELDGEVRLILMGKKTESESESEAASDSAAGSESGSDSA